jgi:hypothetical protein
MVPNAIEAFCVAPLVRRRPTGSRRTQNPSRTRYFKSRSRARPAGDPNSFASSVPSLSGLAALKRCCTTARYSSSDREPSRSGSAAANSFALNLPRNSRVSRVPSFVPTSRMSQSRPLHFGQIERPIVVRVKHLDCTMRRGQRRCRKCHGSSEHQTDDFARYHFLISPNRKEVVGDGGSIGAQVALSSIIPENFGILSRL